MGPDDTVKEIVRIATGAGLSEDAVDLLEQKVAFLARHVTMLEQTNTSLAHENRTLAAEIKTLKTQMGGGKVKADELEPKTRDILKYFYDQSRDISDFEISNHFQLDQKSASYHTEILLRKKFIQVTWEEVQTWHGNCPPLFAIVDAGRDYIKNNWAAIRPKL